MKCGMFRTIFLLSSFVLVAGCSSEDDRLADMVCDFRMNSQHNLADCLNRNFPIGSKLIHIQELLNSAGFSGRRDNSQNFVNFVKRYDVLATVNAQVIVSHNNGIIMKILVNPNTAQKKNIISMTYCDFQSPDYEQFKKCMGKNFPVGSELKRLESVLNSAGYTGSTGSSDDLLNYVKVFDSISSFKSQFLITHANGVITNIQINP